MTSWLGVCLWLFGALLALTAGVGARHEPRVVCYYTNWSVYRPGTAKFNPLNINPYLCTHLIYAFGGFTKENTLKPFDKYQDIEKGGYAKFVGLKTYNKNLKTMLALGGWNEGSTRFSPMVANATRRNILVKNTVKFLRQNKFDGLDLDWEYPSFRDGGKPRDRDNYAQLVQELREEFEKESSKTGRPRLLLTMAVPAGLEYVDKGYDVPKLNKYLDWMNLLTYDYHSSFEPAANHHAPLYPLEEESEYNYDAELNIHHTIKHYLAAGADRHKLVLGIPTYGRSYTLLNPEANEIGAPSDGPGEQGDATREKGYLAYYEICENIRNDDSWTVVQPNPDAMGPYAYRGDQWVGYDDEAIVRKKAQYVVEQGLGGIMFWAIDNDDFRGTCHGKPYPLIEAAKESMLEGLSGIKGNDLDAPLRSSTKKPATRRRPQVKTSSSVKSTAITAKPPSRRISSRRRTSSTTTTTTTEEPIVLSEESGSSLYIGGRTTTPAPPTTPDPGSDFKCEEEGFYPHPRDCKKYFWCLDSGPSNLGIVAHQFSCPSGLLFNKAADSCDYARNVPCKTKKETPAAASSTTTTTTTTQKPTSKPLRISRVTLKTTARTTTTTTSAPEYEEYEYEDESDEKGHALDSEEDPRVIKELIDLIRKVGGIEKLERQLDGYEGSQSESLNSGSSTTPATISRTLYERVLSKATHRKGADAANRGPANNKYSSLRKVPQFSGEGAKEDGASVSSRSRPQYVTIQRNRPQVQELDEDSSIKYSHEVLASESASVEEDSLEDQIQEQIQQSTLAPSHGSQQYVNIRRQRPSTTTEEIVVEITTKPKFSTTRTTARPTTTTEYVPSTSKRPVYVPTTTINYEPVETETSSEELEISQVIDEKDVDDTTVISTSNKYKAIERLRPNLETLSILSSDETYSTAALDSTTLIPTSSFESTTLQPAKTTINIISSETPSTVEETTQTLTTKPENIPVTIVTRPGGLTSKRRPEVTTTLPPTTQDSAPVSKSAARPYPFTKRLYQSQTKDRFNSSDRKRPSVLSGSSPSTSTTSVLSLESPKSTSESVEISSRRSTKLRNRLRYTTEASSSAEPTFITSSTPRSRDSSDFGSKSEQNKNTLTNRRRTLFRRKQPNQEISSTLISNSVTIPTEAPVRKPHFRKRLPTTTIAPELPQLIQVSVTPPSAGLTTPIHDQQALTSLREAESIEDSEAEIRQQKLRADDTIDNNLLRARDIDSAEGVIAMAIRRLVHAPLPPNKFQEDSVLTTPSYSKINRVHYGVQEPTNIPDQPAVATYSTTTRPMVMRVPLESSIYYREPQPFSLTPSTPRYIAQRPVYDYDYPDLHPIRFEPSTHRKGLRHGVLLHSTGALECLDQGTFPHPASCRRFVVCSRMQRGPLVGWQYTCPKGLSYDPVGGICNWAAGLGCKD